MQLTPDAIKVLAHPLRSRLLGALRLDGAATATALAERLATNTGATSYHLRKLASVGLVEETGEGRGRERWGRATTQMHDWNDDLTEGDPDARAAGGWLREHHLRQFVETTDIWLANHDRWPIEWRRLAGSSDYWLTLTPSQLEALMNDLWAVIARYQAVSDAWTNPDQGSGAASDGEPPASIDPAERPQRVALFIHDFPEGEPPR